MEQDPEAIKAQIEDTQQRIGDTVEALAYKTDVPARAKDAVSDGVEAIKSKVSDAVDTARSAVGGAAATVQNNASSVASSLGDATSSARELASNATASVSAVSERFNTFGSFVARYPLGLAIGSIATGFLVGLTLPVSDLEREQIGPIGEQMADQAKTAADNAIAQGKTAVSQAVGDVFSNAQRS